MSTTAQREPSPEPSPISCATAPTTTPRPPNGPAGWCARPELLATIEAEAEAAQR
jgi:hypothetical protein